jgi:hypothetical protein
MDALIFLRTLFRFIYNVIYDFIYDFKYSKIYVNNHRCIFLESNVVIIENVITDTYCKELIELINNTNLNKEEYSKTLRNNVECYEFSLNDYQHINEYKMHDINIMNICFNCVTIFKKIRPFIIIVKDCGYTLRKIYGKTYNHIDWIYDIEKDYRVLSIILFLNDDYDGGVLKFPIQNISYKLKKGSAILFPPYWTHPHEVSTVKPGQYRYTINTWAMQ